MVASGFPFYGDSAFLFSLIAEDLDVVIILFESRGQTSGVIAAEPRQAILIRALMGDHRVIRPHAGLPAHGKSTDAAPEEAVWDEVAPTPPPPNPAPRELVQPAHRLC